MMVVYHTEEHYLLSRSGTFFFHQIKVFFNKNYEQTNLKQKKNIRIRSIRTYHESKTNVPLL
jgi:hypothetical protein